MSQSAFQEQEYHKHFDMGLWKKVLHFARPYKKTIFGLAAIMIIVGGIDAIFPLMTKHAIDAYVIPGKIHGIWKFGLVYLALVIAQAINVFLLIAWAGKIDMAICYDIRKAGFKRLQELSFSYFDKTPVGWLMARMTSDTARLSDTVAWGIVDMVWGSTMMLATTGIMFYLHWKLALVVLSISPVLAFVSMKFQRIILKNYRQVRKINSRITGAFNEGIMGAKTTKTLVREKANLHEFKELTGGMFQASVRAAVMSALYLPLVLAVATVGSGLALWFGGNGVVAGTISYGLLVAFISYARNFFEPIRELARIFAELQNAQASAERIFSMIDTEPDIQNSPEALQKLANEEKMIIQGNIEFNHVDFAYKDGEKVLTDFSLSIEAGEKIALVGETGSGKTTIVNLVCRFYQPTAGILKIDGIDYTQIPLEWLQSQIGVVLQTPHLFSGTIEDNIRYGRLEASLDEIIAAAKLVNAHSFIEQLGNQYQNEVGEGGNLLSTGQKQLISFARALLANPAIFILDEATSSVDTETERLIQDAIDKIMEGRTSFIIAHRLSTIRSADRILVLEKGRVIEAGTHHELLQLKGHYYNLYTNQFLEEHENALLQTN